MERRHRDDEPRSHDGREAAGRSGAGVGDRCRGLLPCWCCLGRTRRLGVCGRLWQPAGTSRPMAAHAARRRLAAVPFPNPLVAASVPLAALASAISCCPATAAWRWRRWSTPRRPGPCCSAASACWAGRKPRWARRGGGSLASSLVFFLTTNLAHWWLTRRLSADGRGPRRLLRGGPAFLPLDAGGRRRLDVVRLRPDLSRRVGPRRRLPGGSVRRLFRHGRLTERETGRECSKLGCRVPVSGAGLTRRGNGGIGRRARLRAWW